jgi:hypothetical protein
VGAVSERELIDPPELFPPTGFSDVAVATGQRLVSVGVTGLAPPHLMIEIEVMALLT